uniref:Uncharacterized protein n=1 Tax=viral metagenome TaxID=1070528 RepID=A0A6C0HR46_9ZZZZ
MGLLGFLLINLGFIAINFYVLIAGELEKIKQEWPLYRCNPSYMFFADNIVENFEYCLAQTSKSTFNEFSGALSSVQSLGFDLQTAGNLNLASFIKSSNMSNLGIGLSLSSFLDMGGSISVLGSIIVLQFKEILQRIGQIVNATGGILNSAVAGTSVVQNKYSRYLNML